MLTTFTTFLMKSTLRSMFRECTLEHTLLQSDWFLGPNAFGITITHHDTGKENIEHDTVRNDVESSVKRYLVGAKME